MAVDDTRFRALFGAHPAGVCVVTAVGGDGRPSGLTISAVCSVSRTPPLLLICVDNGSRTLDAIRHAGAFAVNFLAAGQERLADHFAGKGADKFAGVDWRPSEHALGAPLLPTAQVSAFAECRVRQEIAAGDHRVLLGEIEDAGVSGHAPLVYHRRDYVRLPVPARTG
ncbi:flavin reductase family protein [Streptomyces xanthophaeus]|uniref:flavin reductase family protein n=1 Tax=Streptomyces xanthophaeus TaxID=67385 RepID=UPI00264955F8|nr:flavin reductase family protein [Streptomyces xanthophaeus]WKD32286.1 flavin reductase family protein [Streptomyces xanthophaeus]